MNKNSPTFGKEITSYCDEVTEYCRLTDFTCAKKEQNNNFCIDNNNYMCATGKCDAEIDKCVQCLHDSDCDDDYICKNNACEFKQKFDGQPCSLNVHCQSEKCDQGICKDDQKNGTFCRTKYSCESLVCENSTCGGNSIQNDSPIWPDIDPDHHEDTSSAGVVPVPVPITPNQKSTSGGFDEKYIYMGVAILLFFVLVCYCIYNYRRNKQNNLFVDRGSVFEEPEKLISTDIVTPNIFDHALRNSSDDQLASSMGSEAPLTADGNGRHYFKPTT